MNKALKAIEFDGTTFGMSVDAGAETYKKFKAQVKEEEIISIFGDYFKVLTVPAVWLGAIMGEAHWLVTEIHSFNKFCIEGFKGGEYIYVKYDDEIIDMRNRRQKYHRVNGGG